VLWVVVSLYYLLPSLKTNSDTLYEQILFLFMDAGYSITVWHTNYAFFSTSLFSGFLTPVFFSCSNFFTFFILLYMLILKTRCLGIRVYLALIGLN